MTAIDSAALDVQSGGIDISMAPRLVDVDVNNLRASLTNPRNRFATEQLAELAHSMGLHGLAQPILLRPIETQLTSDPAFEIVAGERRWRAARLLGWLTIPALIRPLNDQQTLELQVVENLQREDLHPLEEAEGYERLIQEHGYTVEGLATKVGKSEGYIYARLKLTALVPEARTAFYDGKLNPSTAILVARMTPVIQAAAVLEVTAGDDGHPLSVRRTAELLRSRYMLDLRVAVFDTESVKLLPPAGPCTTCPKRTGNQRQLFADVANTDTCTDPVCFNDKKAAHWAFERGRIVKAGRTIIEGEAAAKIVRPWGAIDFHEPVANVINHVQREIGLEHDVAVKTVSEILRKQSIKPVAIEMPDGSFTDALTQEQDEKVSFAIEKLFDKAKPTGTKAGQSEADKERDRRFALEQKRRTCEAAFENSLVNAVLAAASAVPPASLELLAIMVYGIWKMLDEYAHATRRRELFRKRDLALNGDDEINDLTFRGWTEQASGAELSLAMLEMVVIVDSDRYYDDEACPITRRLAAWYGIDHQALHKELVDDVLEPKKKVDLGVKYRNAETGETWTGRGKKPRWLEGKNPADYAFESTTEAA